MADTISLIAFRLRKMRSYILTKDIFADKRLPNTDKVALLVLSGKGGKAEGEKDAAKTESADRMIKVGILGWFWFMHAALWV